MTKVTKKSTFIRFIALVMIAMTMLPISVPRMVPLPPQTLAPPRTQEQTILLNALVGPMVGPAEFSLAEVSTPLIPAMQPPMK